MNDIQSEKPTLQRKDVWSLSQDSHFCYLKSEAHGTWMFPVTEFDQLIQVVDCINAAIDRAVASAQEQSDNNRKAFNDAEYELANANADIHRLRAQLTEAQADTKRLITAAQKVKPIVRRSSGISLERNSPVKRESL